MGALLRKLLLTLGTAAALAQAGCGFLQERGEDFLDCWRGDLTGPGLPGAWVHAGPVAHLGLGAAITPGICASPEKTVGWVYNLPGESRATSDMHFLLLHGSDEGHGCFGLLPGLQSLIMGTPWSRSPVHVFDVEVGFHVLFFGARAGVSPWEFVDFLLGWFGVDPAGDDPPEGRGRRRLKGAKGPT